MKSTAALILAGLALVQGLDVRVQTRAYIRGSAAANVEPEEKQGDRLNYKNWKKGGHADLDGDHDIVGDKGEADKDKRSEFFQDECASVCPEKCVTKEDADLDGCTKCDECHKKIDEQEEQEEKKEQQEQDDLDKKHDEDKKREEQEEQREEKQEQQEEEDLQKRQDEEDKKREEQDGFKHGTDGGRTGLPQRGGMGEHKITLTSQNNFSRGDSIGDISGLDLDKKHDEEAEALDKKHDEEDNVADKAKAVKAKADEEVKTVAGKAKAVEAKAVKAKAAEEVKAVKAKTIADAKYIHEYEVWLPIHFTKAELNDAAATAKAVANAPDDKTTLTDKKQNEFKKWLTIHFTKGQLGAAAAATNALATKR